MLAFPNQSPSIDCAKAEADISRITRKMMNEAMVDCFGFIFNVF